MIRINGTYTNNLMNILDVGYSQNLMYGCTVNNATSLMASSSYDVGVAANATTWVFDGSIGGGSSLSDFYLVNAGTIWSTHPATNIANNGTGRYRPFVAHLDANDYMPVSGGEFTSGISFSGATQAGTISLPGYASGVGTLANGVTFGDGDTGIYELLDDSLALKAGGTAYFYVSGSAFQGSQPGGGALYYDNNVSACSFHFRSDQNSGMNWIAADNFGLYSGGTLALEVKSDRSIVAANTVTATGYTAGASPGISITNSWVDVNTVTNTQIFTSGLLTSWAQAGP
jgi:hypothetical protein